MLGQVATYDGNSWVDWNWVNDHWGDIRNAAQTHLVVTVEVVLLGVLIALPLALAAARRPLLRSVVLSVSSLLYTIPSLAAVALLSP